jgi:hypothetical protein
MARDKLVSRYTSEFDITEDYADNNPMANNIDTSLAITFVKKHIQFFHTALTSPEQIEALFKKYNISKSPLLDDMRHAFDRGDFISVWMSVSEFRRAITENQDIEDNLKEYFELNPTMRAVLAKHAAFDNDPILYPEEQAARTKQENISDNQYSFFGLPTMVAVCGFLNTISSLIDSNEQITPTIE